MKPIFIVRAPSTISYENVNTTYEYLKKDIVSDYHPIIVIDNSITEWAFELYNVQNATEIEIEELKKMVMGNIKEILNQ
jgi:hypothetical protein